jgi:hypothetical protein
MLPEWSAVPSFTEPVEMELPAPHCAVFGAGSAIVPTNGRTLVRSVGGTGVVVLTDGRDNAFRLEQPAVFGFVLLDAMDAAAIKTSGSRVFFGTTGAILRGDTGVRDRGLPYAARIRPADVIPAGLGGEAVGGPLYLTVEGIAFPTLNVTPRADGRHLPTISLTLPPGEAQRTISVEVDLRDDDAHATRYGVRGSSLGAVIDIPQVDSPYFALHNIELETEVVQECLPGVVFTPEALIDASLDLPVTLLFGGAASLYAADRGSTDAGQPVAFRGRSAAGSPAGEGGEAEFDVLQIALLRANEADVELQVLPHLDGVALAPIPVTLRATARPVAELVELGLSQPYEVGGVVVGRYAPRGTSLEVQIASTAALPEGDIIIEQIDVEGETVQEAMEPANG